MTACPRLGGAEGDAAGGFSIPGPHSLAHREISGWLAARAAADAFAQQRTLCPVRPPPPAGPMQRRAFDSFVQAVLLCMGVAWS